MGVDPINYLTVDGGRLVAITAQEFDRRMVNSLLTARGISFETQDGVVTTVADEDRDDDTYTYLIQFLPESDTVTVHSRDTIDAGDLFWYLNDLVPELLGTDEPEVEITYTFTFGFIHPTVGYETLADVLDAATRESTDDNVEFLRVPYTATKADIDDDDVTLRIFEDGIVYPSHVDETLITEFTTYCNGQLHEAFPSPPPEFAIDELPEGWFAPVSATHPEITEIITPSTRPEDITDLAETHDLPPNTIVVMLLDVIGAGLYAVESLDSDGRAAFYNTYKDSETIFHELLLGDDGDVIDRGAFLAETLWDADVAHQFVAEKERYQELQRIAESYSDYDLTTGDIWRMHSPTAHVWLDVKLREYGQLPTEDFPHTPVWIGDVVEMGDGHDGDIPSEAAESIGDTVIVDGRELDECVTSV